MTDLGLTDKPTLRVCFMIDRYSFCFSLSGNSYLFTNSFHGRKYFFSWRKIFLFTMRIIFFHENNSAMTVCCERNIWVSVIKKGAILQRIVPFLDSISPQFILILLWDWIDRNVLFYLFSASIALIFCFTSSISSLSFWMRRFISSIRLLPFFELMLRKPRLFS